MSLTLCRNPSDDVDGAPGIPTAGSTLTGPSGLSPPVRHRRGSAAAATPRTMVKTIQVTRVRVDTAAVDSVAIGFTFAVPVPTICVD
jgi:hypothetical protein